MVDENHAFSFEDSPSPVKNSSRPSSRSSIGRKQATTFSDSFDFDDDDKTRSPVPPPLTPKNVGKRSEEPIFEEAFDLETQPLVKSKVMPRKKTPTPKKLTRKTPIAKRKEPPKDDFFDDDDDEFMVDVPTTSRGQKTPQNKQQTAKRPRNSTPKTSALKRPPETPIVDLFDDDDDFLIEETVKKSPALSATVKLKEGEKSPPAVEVVNLDDSFGFDDMDETRPPSVKSEPLNDSFDRSISKTPPGEKKTNIDDSFDDFSVGGDFDDRKLPTTTPKELSTSQKEPSKEVTIGNQYLEAQGDVVDDDFFSQKTHFAQKPSTSKVEKEESPFSLTQSPRKNNDCFDFDSFEGSPQRKPENDDFAIMEDSFQVTPPPRVKSPSFAVETPKNLNKPKDNLKTYVKRYKELKEEAERVETVASQLSLVMRVWREMEECVRWRRKKWLVQEIDNSDPSHANMVEAVDLCCLASGESLLTLKLMNPAKEDLKDWTIRLVWNQIEEKCPGSSQVTSTESYHIDHLTSGCSSTFQMKIDFADLQNPILMRFSISRTMKFGKSARTFRVALDPTVFSCWSLARITAGEVKKSISTLKKSHGHFEMTFPMTLLHLLNGHWGERCVGMLYSGIFHGCPPLSAATTSPLRCDIRKSIGVWREVFLCVDRAPSAYTLLVFCKDPEFRKQLEHHLRVRMIVEMSKLKCRRSNTLQILFTTENVEALFTSMIYSFT